ncbi:hypothetical protein B0A50_06067 [Salinomyces thailandicus]|uniref:26S proteasome complex subunit SEM1 n=1 Tax=Salinomyces thailandicus TaxID=706561 RepID=A0A4V6WJP9_9PEZI|nr:hypothetical protein B0A50_06067 [Salinomyces thailandica]
MSGAAQGTNNSLSKHKDATTQDSKDTPQAPQKAVAQLEEDDEFEDFPVEDWAKEDEVGQQAGNTHLWEESWDDDDTSDDFAVQLKEQMKSVEGKR